MLHWGALGVGYSRHVLVEVRQVLLCGVQVQHSAGVAAQLPVPGGAASLPGGEGRGEMCPGARQDEHGGGTGTWGVCRSGKGCQASPWSSFPSHNVGVGCRGTSPSPPAGGLLLLLAAALVVPGAGGSRGTPAAAGGGDGRCSSAVSGCSWWPSAKRQGRESHHLPEHMGTVTAGTQDPESRAGEPRCSRSRVGAGSELRGGSSTCRSWGRHLRAPDKPQGTGSCPTLPGQWGRSPSTSHPTFL